MRWSMNTFLPLAWALAVSALVSAQSPGISPAGQDGKIPAVAGSAIGKAMSAALGRCDADGISRPRGRLADACAEAAATPASGAITAAAPQLARQAASLRSTKIMKAGYGMRGLAVSGLGTLGRVDGIAPGLVVSDVSTTGATYLLRAYQFGDQAPNLTIARVQMLDNGPGGILVRGASSGTISDVKIVATRPNDNCKKVPEGVALAGKATGDTGGPWLIERVSVTGIRSVGCRFLNGDGFSVERGYRDGVIRLAYAADNSDAGFDIKSPTFQLDHTVAERNRRSYKLWADQSHGTLTSINPGQPGSGAASHIQVQGARRIRIERLIARSTTTAPIFQIENAETPADITVGACELTVPAGTKMLVGKAVLALGPGCVL
ncbi:hypothetical protein [Sphingomonas solaris]|uniref:Right-handed parallel beta-helix repeat-containing protein n=1 Tax=Alterirhizorhabdus solaris TaxID=2529389 RepID=A0A558R2I2_9SPHN|nr:hypothetical protein [Sphingomonas solaris]TVV73593.1 hypothetical protein FOY91_11925 [Sphingomonas solaris]